MVNQQWIIDNFLHIIVWAIFVVLIHELGHYIAYRFYGIKPKITFTKIGVIQMGDETSLFQISPKKYFYIALFGILTGGFFTAVVLPEFNLVYLLGCVIDLAIMISSVNYNMKDDKSVGEYQWEALKKIKFKQRGKTNGIIRKER